MNATELIGKYFDLWNERDAAAREVLMKSVVTEDSTYTDHDYAGLRGHDELTEAIGVAHGKFGDLRFSVGSVIDVHHDRALCAWELGTVASGYNVVEFEDGRIRSVVAFIA